MGLDQRLFEENVKHITEDPKTVFAGVFSGRFAYISSVGGQFHWWEHTIFGGTDQGPYDNFDEAKRAMLDYLRRTATTDYGKDSVMVDRSNL